MDAVKSALSAGVVIYDILANHAPAVTAITEQIFPVMLAEVTAPYVFYRRSGLEQDPTKARQGSTGVQIDITCVGRDYDESLALAEAVRDALDGAQHQAEGLYMRSCYLIDASEDWVGDSYTQILTFKIKI